MNASFTGDAGRGDTVTNGVQASALVRYEAAGAVAGMSSIALSVRSSSIAAASSASARDDAVGVEAVRRAAGIVRVGRGARRRESERHELHARRVQVLVLAAARVHAVEAADDEVVDHVDDRLGDGVVHGLEGVDAFLHDHVVHLEAFLHHRHLVALLAVEPAHFRRVLHRHDAHAVGARRRP